MEDWIWSIVQRRKWLQIDGIDESIGARTAQEIGKDDGHGSMEWEVRWRERWCYRSLNAMCRFTRQSRDLKGVFDSSLSSGSHVFYRCWRSQLAGDTAVFLEPQRRAIAIPLSRYIAIPRSLFVAVRLFVANPTYPERSPEWGVGVMQTPHLRDLRLLRAWIFKVSRSPLDKLRPSEPALRFPDAADMCTSFHELLMFKGSQLSLSQFFFYRGGIIQGSLPLNYTTSQLPVGWVGI